MERRVGELMTPRSHSFSCPKGMRRLQYLEPNPSHFTCKQNSVCVYKNPSNPFPSWGNGSLHQDFPKCSLSKTTLPTYLATVDWLLLILAVTSVQKKEAANYFFWRFLTKWLHALWRKKHILSNVSLANTWGLWNSSYTSFSLITLLWLFSHWLCLYPPHPGFHVPGTSFILHANLDAGVRCKERKRGIQLLSLLPNVPPRSLHNCFKTGCLQILVK